MSTRNTNKNDENTNENDEALKALTTSEALVEENDDGDDDEKETLDFKVKMIVHDTYTKALASSNNNASFAFAQVKALREMRARSERNVTSILRRMKLIALTNEETREIERIAQVIASMSSARLATQALTKAIKSAKLKSAKRVA